MLPSLLTFAAVLTPALGATLRLCGDSTMAFSTAAISPQGWGTPVTNYFSSPVVNHAVGGSSTRSYYNSFWPNVYQQVAEGDVVVLEWGHNDSGSPAKDSVKPSVAGTGDETYSQVNSDGSTEIVHTASWYIRQMSQAILDKGATPIISTQTPNGPDQSSTSYAPSAANAPRFVGYYIAAANMLGSQVGFANHFVSCANGYATMSLAEIKGFFPLDHTHTNAKGAVKVAEWFIAAARCDAKAYSLLTPLMNSAGKAIAASC